MTFQYSGPRRVPNYLDSATAPAGRVGTSPSTNPAPVPGGTGDPTRPAPSSLLDDLQGLFPWLKTVGLSASWFQETAATSASDAEVVAKLRETNQYKARFAAIRRNDGSMRMSEAQYLSQEDSYRQLMTQYGVDPAKMDNPADFVGFFNSDIDPNELKQRLDIHRKVKEGGQDMLDAFYVYAGMRVSQDDLYAAVVDPAAGQKLTEDYNQKVAAQPFDYTTWIKRATEAGLARVSTTLTSLQNNGALSGQAVQSVLQTDPAFAHTIMDALYHGGDPNSGQTMDLQSLMASFEYAAIGAAATGSGLQLPTKERIQELRAAGVDRVSAQKAYTDYGQKQNQYAGAVERAYGNRSFTQADFEKAALLGGSSEMGVLDKSMKQDAALGEAGGQFNIANTRRGQYGQAGLNTR